jgi:hypothetical protein
MFRTEVADKTETHIICHVFLCYKSYGFRYNYKKLLAKAPELLCVTYIFKLLRLHTEIPSEFLLQEHN